MRLRVLTVLVCGCRQCECRVEGSLDNQPICSSDTGDCRCKEYVEGKNCDTCKPGFFGLTAANPLGCHPCFCYGHSSDCSSARGYVAQVTQSDFSSGTTPLCSMYMYVYVYVYRVPHIVPSSCCRSSALARSDTERRVHRPALRRLRGERGCVGSQHGTHLLHRSRFVTAQLFDLQALTRLLQVLVSVAERYLGDQRFSYSRNLSFTLRIGEEGAGVSVSDVIIEGDGVTVRAPIYAQGNPLPRTVAQEYNFVLHEHPSYQWTPSVSSREFIRMLSNLRSIRIRATYTRLGQSHAHVHCIIQTVLRRK